jgi:hypothetical protein
MLVNKNTLNKVVTNIVSSFKEKRPYGSSNMMRVQLNNYCLILTQFDEGTVINGHIPYEMADNNCQNEITENFTFTVNAVKLAELLSKLKDLSKHIDAYDIHYDKEKTLLSIQLDNGIYTLNTGDGDNFPDLALFDYKGEIPMVKIEVKPFYDAIKFLTKFVGDTGVLTGISIRINRDGDKRQLVGYSANKLTCGKFVTPIFINQVDFDLHEVLLRPTAYRAISQILEECDLYIAGQDDLFVVKIQSDDCFYMISTKTFYEDYPSVEQLMQISRDKTYVEYQLDLKQFIDIINIFSAYKPDCVAIKENIKEQSIKISVSSKIGSAEQNIMGKVTHYKPEIPYENYDSLIDVSLLKSTLKLFNTKKTNIQRGSSLQPLYIYETNDTEVEKAAVLTVMNLSH